MLLDLGAHSVQPTTSQPPLWAMGGNQGTGSEGQGFAWGWDRGVKILPGTGLAMIFVGGTLYDPSDVTFIWEE